MVESRGGPVDTAGCWSVPLSGVHRSANRADRGPRAAGEPPGSADHLGGGVGWRL